MRHTIGGRARFVNPPFQTLARRAQQQLKRKEDIEGERCFRFIYKLPACPPGSDRGPTGELLQELPDNWWDVACAHRARDRRERREILEREHQEAIAWYLNGLPDQERDASIQRMDREQAGWDRLRALVTLAYYSAMRVGELKHL